MSCRRNTTLDYRLGVAPFKTVSMHTARVEDRDRVEIEIGLGLEYRLSNRVMEHYPII